MSLNLSQAVMVFGYEWWLARGTEQPSREFQVNGTHVATKGELDNFMSHLLRAADDSGFLRNEQKRPGMIRNLRHFFTRGEATKQELATLHGIISELSKRRDRD